MVDLLGVAELRASRRDAAEFWVGVADGARGAGIGTSLVDAIQVFAARLGIRTLGAEVALGTPWMLQTLLASGFRVMAEDNDAAWLEKTLDGLSTPRLPLAFGPHYAP